MICSQPTEITCSARRQEGRVVPASPISSSTMLSIDSVSTGMLPYASKRCIMRLASQPRPCRCMTTLPTKDAIDRVGTRTSGGSVMNSGRSCRTNFSLRTPNMISCRTMSCLPIGSAIFHRPPACGANVALHIVANVTGSIVVMFYQLASRQREKREKNFQFIQAQQLCVACQGTS